MTMVVEEIGRVRGGGGGSRGFSGFVASSWLYKARPPVRFWMGRGRGRQFRYSPQHIITHNPPFSLSSLCLRCYFVGVEES